jgi:hypothetical protein
MLLLRHSGILQGSKTYFMEDHFSGGRPSEAQEFYVFRPKGFDADRLIRIAERIIHDHVVATKRQMAAGWKSRAQGFGVAFTPVS